MYILIKNGVTLFNKTLNNTFFDIVVQSKVDFGTK
jgi:hypothetical protein